MISRLRNAAAGTTGNSTNPTTGTGNSIFGNMGLSTAQSGDGNSITGGNAYERAAATAAAQHRANTNTSSSAYSSGNSVVSTPATNLGNAEQEPDDVLPPGWRLVCSRHSGQDYYLHIASGHSQWEKPTAADGENLKRNIMEAQKNQQNSNNVANVLSGVSSRMGIGLSSMLASANKNFHSSMVQGGDGNTQFYSSSRANALKGTTDIDRDGQLVQEIFENDRIQSKLQAGKDPKKFSDRMATPNVGMDELPHDDPPAGYMWTTEWEIDMHYAIVDQDGWTYGVDFPDLVRLLEQDLSHATRHPTDAVRRRRWVRYRQLISDESNMSPPSPRDPLESEGGGSTSSSSWRESSSGGGAFGDSFDDPFFRTAQHKAGGFNFMRIPGRGGKDNTKDYQAIQLSGVQWLVTENDKPQSVPTDELLREKTANLEEQMNEAATKYKALEKQLKLAHEQKSKEITIQQKKLDTLVSEYKRVKKENEVLRESVIRHRDEVEKLREEATEKDRIANEEQRALNAEMAATNQGLEEKAKALATARLRYKRDNKSLAQAIDDARRRLEKQKSKANADAQDPVTQELKKEMEKIRSLHQKLEIVRSRRLQVEEESKALYKKVVDTKANIKLKSKQKLASGLSEIDQQIKALKDEQATLTKKLTAENVSGDDARTMNSRRNDIRTELGSLKQKRSALLAEKRKQDEAHE